MASGLSRCRAACGSASAASVVTSCCSRCRSAAGATLEVGGIPACALELEARGCQLLSKGRSSAGRAIGQRRIRHFLKHIFGVATGPALIRINRHNFYSACKRQRREIRKTLNYRRQHFFTAQNGLAAGTSRHLHQNKGRRSALCWRVAAVLIPSHCLGNAPLCPARWECTGAPKSPAPCPPSRPKRQPVAAGRHLPNRG